MEGLKAAAGYRLTAGQAEFDLGLDFAPPCLLAGGVVRCRSRVADGLSGARPDPCLPGARVRAGRERDAVSGQWVLALPRFAKESWRQHLAVACAAHALRRSCRLVPGQHGVS